MQFYALASRHSNPRIQDDLRTTVLTQRRPWFPDNLARPRPPTYGSHPRFRSFSVSTLGMVDFRSDKERTARKAAKDARYVKKSARGGATQTRLLAEQNWLLQRAAPAADGSPPSATVSERLAELDRLVASEVITGEEPDQRRAEIIQNL
jgi:hypothetical protein